MKDIAIFGAGGLGKELLFELRELCKRGEDYNILGFIDDNPFSLGREIHGAKVIGDSQWLINYKNPLCVVLAVGSACARKQIYEKISANLMLSFPSIIAHDAVCSDYVSFGKGCIVCFSDVFTVDISLGNFVLVNNGCTVGHDAVIDDFVTLYPGVRISGNTHLGKAAEMGAGSCIIQGKSIGDGTIVGAGAVVINDLPANCTAVGVPAKVIKQRNFQI